MSLARPIPVLSLWTMPVVTVTLANPSGVSILVNNNPILYPGACYFSEFHWVWLSWSMPAGVIIPVNADKSIHPGQYTGLTPARFVTRVASSEFYYTGHSSGFIYPDQHQFCYHDQCQWCILTRSTPVRFVTMVNTYMFCKPVKCQWVYPFCSMLADIYISIIFSELCCPY